MEYCKFGLLPGPEFVKQTKTLEKYYGDGLGVDMVKYKGGQFSGGQQPIIDSFSCVTSKVSEISGNIQITEFNTTKQKAVTENQQSNMLLASEKKPPPKVEISPRLKK